MERGAAEKPLAHGGPAPLPELSRRQKRRELDARRSKCRIRIGGHLERWCRLKEQLGFALHSQLAQFLLDRSLKNSLKTPKTVPDLSRGKKSGFSPRSSLVFPRRYSSHGSTWSSGGCFPPNFTWFGSFRSSWWWIPLGLGAGEAAGAALGLQILRSLILASPKNCFVFFFGKLFESSSSQREP
uniref:Zinc finger protein 692 n=1 Tax=Taeniopygia guttata TaxID=59729 RepID=A0A674H9A6_TAEGU